MWKYKAYTGVPLCDCVKWGGGGSEQILKRKLLKMLKNIRPEADAGETDGRSTRSPKQLLTNNLVSLTVGKHQINLSNPGGKAFFLSVCIFFFSSKMLENREERTAEQKKRCPRQAGKNPGG